ncbi:Protein of unknown function [Pyronema omphalodes CBS 100304]|uniref:Uncharacterized protein n=1 Tax=Pyronema omphalodes (strain CBS 100304) TaxID=1076935 RepID=U4L4L3_PYROM|nr:Protein of unknown function [Pyronema omphalodes CBS 100304]
MHGATTDRYMEKEAWEQIIQFIYISHHFLPGGTYPLTYYGQDIWSMRPEQKVYLKYRETNEFLKALGTLHDELWDTLLDAT